jgi:chromosome segregation ATPase
MSEVKEEIKTFLEELATVEIIDDIEDWFADATYLLTVALDDLGSKESENIQLLALNGELEEENKILKQRFKIIEKHLDYKKGTIALKDERIKELETKISEIETESYGWRMDELKSDYNSVLEQLEGAEEDIKELEVELRDKKIEYEHLEYKFEASLLEIQELKEEIAFQKLHNLNLLQEIKNGNI